MTVVQTRTMLSAGAQEQGALWSERAADWAEAMAPLFEPLYRAVLGRLRLAAQSMLLDVGCGAGAFLRLARSSGARVRGLDASEALAAIARERVPGVHVDIGDAGALPYEDDTFDVVTVLDSLQYAAPPLAVLREATRVARLGGQVCVATWGRPEDCEASASLAALEDLAPPRPVGAPGPLALGEHRVVEHLLVDAELTPVGIFDVDVPWRFASLDAALRGLLSSGPAARAIRHSGEQRVRGAVTEAIRPFRTSRGEYALENRFRLVIARRIVSLYTTLYPRS